MKVAHWTRRWRSAERSGKPFAKLCWIYGFANEDQLLKLISDYLGAEIIDPLT